MPVIFGASRILMLEDRHKVAEVKRGFSRKLADDLRERYNVARNKQAGADPERLKRATYFVVAIFPVLSLIAFLASYATVYAARVEQGGVNIRWSLNCSASSPEGTFWRWTLQCSHGPIASLNADELISEALEDATNRSFIDGKCTADKKESYSDMPSRYLGGYSVHCDLIDAYKAVQAESVKDILFLLAAMLVFYVFMTPQYPDVYDAYCRNNPGLQGQLFGKTAPPPAPLPRII